MSNDNEPNKYEAYHEFDSTESDLSILLDSRLVRRTQTLFVDVNNNKKYEPLYTMREQDYKGYISAYQIFMHSVDEYDAALKIVGSIDHWNKLCSLKWFKEGGLGFTGIDQWRQDMIDRDLRTAKRALIQAAGRGDSAAATKLANWNKTINKNPVAPTSKTKKDSNQEPSLEESKGSKIANLLDKLPNKT